MPNTKRSEEVNNSKVNEREEKRIVKDKKDIPYKKCNSTHTLAEIVFEFTFWPFRFS